MKISIIESEKHVNVKEFFAENQDGYNVFWQDLCKKYRGWTIEFIYRNCNPPIEFLSQVSAALLESSIITSLTREDFIPTIWHSVTLVTAENFDSFTPLHDKLPNMYWTSTRILADLTRWRIYMLGNSYVLMSLWGNDAEIFALEISTIEEGRELLSVAASYAFENSKTKLLYFVEDDSHLHLESAQNVGFIVCGKSVAYQTII